MHTRENHYSLPKPYVVGVIKSKDQDNMTKGQIRTFRVKSKVAYTESSMTRQLE